MTGYLAYDRRRLLELRAAVDAAVWHLAATRFEHPFCEEFRPRILAVRPRLEALRDGVLQPVIDCDALDTFVAAGYAISPIVVGGDVLDTAAEIRGYLEGLADPPRSDIAAYGAVAAALLTMTPAEVAACWAGLTADERTSVIEQRPDLAAAALDGGAAMSDADLRALDTANAFVAFSERFAVAIDAQVHLRVATISLANGYAVVARMRSDGTVHVAIVDQAAIGVGVESESPDGASASAMIGAFAAAERVFVFPDEAAADEAVTHLFAEVADYDGGDALADLVDAAAGPAWNDENDFEQWVADNWAAHGYLRRDQAGVYAEVAAGLESDLVEAEASARLSVSVYDTDLADADVADGAPARAARTGVLVMGAVHGEVQSSTPVGGRAAGHASFSVDAYTTDEGDEYVTVTVAGAASTGAVANLVDLAGIDIDTHVAAGALVTAIVTVPLAADQVRHVVSAVAAGNVPTALAELYDDADVTISLDAVVTTTSEASLDAGAVEGSISRTRSTATNVATWRKLPDGEIYSQSALDAAIGQQLGPLPTDQDLAATYGTGTEVVHDDRGDPLYIDTGDECVVVP